GPRASGAGGGDRRRGARRAPHHDRRRLQHRRALPRQPAGLPRARRARDARYGRARGGLQTEGAGMTSFADFMARAYSMEIEAQERYQQFAEQLETHNNPEVAQVFRKLAEI